MTGVSYFALLIRSTCAVNISDVSEIIASISIIARATDNPFLRSVCVVRVPEGSRRIGSRTSERQQDEREESVDRFRTAQLSESVDRFRTAQLSLCGIVPYIHDMDILIECLVPIMVDVSGMTKIMNSMLCVNEIRALLDQIRDDFYLLKNSDDSVILQKYANTGKRFSTIYLCVMCMLTVVFILLPFQPLILRVANATTRPLLHRVEYYVDMDKYYFPILIHGYFTAIICVTSIVATDAIFITFMQHACGLFIITGSRIEQAIQEVYQIGNTNPPVTKDTAYQNLVQCVHNHRGALRINLNWYDASPRTRKLVLFMMMKTQPPCVLTAGGMFVLCMETFATIVKTAMSYFTFLRSAH